MTFTPREMRFINRALEEVNPVLGESLADIALRDDMRFEDIDGQTEALKSVFPESDEAGLLAAELANRRPSLVFGERATQDAPILSDNTETRLMGGESAKIILALGEYAQNSKNSRHRRRAARMYKEGMTLLNPALFQEAGQAGQEPDCAD